VTFPCVVYSHYAVLDWRRHMCLFFYISGVATGYLAWRLTSAPKLWDSEEEAKFWRSKWISAQNQLDKLNIEKD